MGIRFSKLSTIQLTKRSSIILLSLLYVLVNGFLFYQNGVKVVNDTHRYIEYANGLSGGFYFDVHNFWYIGYCLYIFIINTVHSSVTALVVGQYILGYMAIMALHHTSLAIWNSNRAAFLSVILYLLFIDISLWNSYILAESLYTSFTCFSLYGLAVIYKGKRDWWIIAIVSLVVIFTFSIKPTGIALLGAVLVCIAYRVLQLVDNRILKVGMLVCGGTLFLLLVNRMLTTYLIMENYQLGEVIYAVSTISHKYEVQWLLLSTPENMVIPSNNYPPLLKIVSFAFHHPVYWSKLCLAKVCSLLLHIRPFWSMKHNLASLLVLLPSYAFAGWTIFRIKSHPFLTTFVVTFLLIHTLSICITSDDWDGRFLIPMLPVIFLLTGFGLSNVLAKCETVVTDKSF